MVMQRNGVMPLVGFSFMLPLLAQAALPQNAQPDAGRLSRELKPPLNFPQPSITLTLPAPGREIVMPGGLRVTLSSVEFSGNVVFSQQQLAAILQGAMGKQYDLAGLFVLADQISAYYRERGYTFAQATVPLDGFRDGVLTMQIVEGIYGERKAAADTSRRSAQAQRFLEPLLAGAPIHAPTLEHRLQLLNDQPGYSVLPVIRPGMAVGSGDLGVKLTRTPLVTGSIGVNNHGNRYSGYYQAYANFELNSPFLFGDQLEFSLLTSDQRLQSSSLNYSLPLGGNGLRASASHSHTEYKLGREFAFSNANGRAQVTSLGLSYPLLRSRQSNLTATVQAQHKRFYDNAVVGASSGASDSGALKLMFNRNDPYGVSYGKIDWVFGKFDEQQLITPSSASGRFSLINSEVIRLQRVNDRLDFFARMNAQLASANLHSSERFSLGGAYGIRAYAGGEGIGDEGILTQLELRYKSTSKLAPFVFFDIGRSNFAHKPVVTSKNSRSLSGLGVGLRYQYGPLSMETLIAHRLVGGDLHSDPRNAALTAWFIFNYAF